MSASTTIMNRHKDPHAFAKCATWHGSIQQASDNQHWMYTADNYGSVYCWDPYGSNQLVGKVLYARVASTATQSIIAAGMENATTIACGDDWIAARVADNNMGNHTLWLRYGPFTLLERAIYTPEDWEHVYSQYQQGELSSPYWGVPATATTDNAQPPITT